MRMMLLQAARFGAVGMGATLLHLVVALMLIRGGWEPLVANFAAFLSAFMLSFMGHLQWSFREQAADRQGSLLRYAVVAVGGFALNQASFAMLLEWTTLPHQVALVIVLSGVAGSTFVCSKLWAFRSAAQEAAEEEMMEN